MTALLPQFIVDRYKRGELEGSFRAHTLFVDVSGFSAVTEALMQHGAEGAEVLSDILGSVFEPMVDTVYRCGGFITNFAGDAFTAIFDSVASSERAVIDADAQLILTCGTIIQEKFRKPGSTKTKFGDFTFGVKIGISSGEVEWGILGDASRAFYFRGAPITACGVAQSRAKKGDVVVDAAFRACVVDPAIRFEAVDDAHARLDLSAALPRPPKAPPTKRTRQPEDLVAQFVPEAVIAGGLVGEFRDVSSIFISFDGTPTRNTLDHFVSIVLRRARDCSGYVEEIQFTEGTSIPCFFGAPVAIENSISRAIDFILAIERDVADDPELVAIRLRAGISHGRVFAGTLGGKQRCQYAILGTMVNLAARMMAHGSWGDILVAQRIAQEPGYSFQDKGDIAYKNFAQPMPTFALIGENAGDEEFFTDQMVGRVTELRMLTAFAQPIFQGEFAGIAYVYGEAGIGKSQLSHSLKRALAQGGALTWFTCQCDEVLSKPFHPFIPFLKRYFEYSPERSAHDNMQRLVEKLEHLTTVVASLSQWKNRSNSDDIIRDLKRAGSVLGALIGLSSHDSLYAQLDAKARYDSTIATLRALFLAESIVQPVVIEIEDAQWIDSDTDAFLKSFARVVETFPVLLIANARYADDGSLPHFDLDNVLEMNLRLKQLTKDDLRLLAESLLGDGIESTLLDLLFDKTLGNPFFVGQMLAYLRDNGLMEQSESVWRVKPEARRKVVLPETISAILTSRIDRLSQRVKEVVKSASVIGREFELQLLAEVLRADVKSEVKQAEQRQIWSAMNELHYIFKHALLRDAAYDMQLRAHLRQSHKVTADAMVRLYKEAIADHSSDIAYHYERAELQSEAMSYLEMAGDHARENYQNEKAIELYDRLLAIIENRPDQLSLVNRTLRTKGLVHELIGRWSDADIIYRRAIAVAMQSEDERAVFQSQRSLTWLQYLRGEFDSAMTGCVAQLAIAESLNDRHEIASITAEMGGIYAAQQDYENALACHTRNLAISRELDDESEIAKSLNNLGSVCDVIGEQATAMKHYQQSLELYEKLRDRRHVAAVFGNIGVLHSSRGDFEEAIRCYQRQLDISEEIGDVSSVAIAVGNMGIAYDQQGDYPKALECYDRALREHRAIGYHVAVAGWLQGKAEAAFRIVRAQRTMNERERRSRLLEIRQWAEECVAISTEHGFAATLFSGEVILARIMFAMGDRDDALVRLRAQLESPRSVDDGAALLYEIAMMSAETGARTDAIHFGGLALSACQSLIANGAGNGSTQQAEELTLMLRRIEETIDR